MARKRDDTVKLVLRLPPPLHQRLTRAAWRRNQSLNSEMIHRLEQSFTKESEAKEEASYKARLDEALERIRRAGFEIARLVERKTEDDGEQK